jgi:protein-disulfide isomerase
MNHLKSKITLIAVLSLAGALISAWQTRLYLLTLSGLGSAKSFCNIGQTFDCTAVEMSKYAEFLPGIPLSAVALSGYLLILVLAIMQLGSSAQKHSRIKLLTFSTVAFLFSIIYFLIMLHLGKLCLLCLCVDALNLALVITAYRLPQGTEEAQSLKNTFVPSLIAGVVAVGITALLLKGLDPQSDVNQAEVHDFIDSVIAAQPVPVTIPSDAFVIGDPNAKVTLVEFGDFQCPPCREAAASLLKRYGNQLKFVFFNFPWSSECNDSLKQVMHPFACEAASAAVCAGIQGRFQDAYENLFEVQGEFATGNIAALLNRQVPNLDQQKMNACLKVGVIERIKKDAALGVSLKVGTTPTFFINGRKIEGGLPTGMWIQIIDRLM